MHQIGLTSSTIVPSQIIKAGKDVTVRDLSCQGSRKYDSKSPVRKEYAKWLIENGVMKALFGI